MKKILIPIVAVSALAATTVPALAQGWQSINHRQANIDRRIDQGVRNGQLTRNEAFRLRAEFRDLNRLEDRYRRNGLNNWERADLDRRFDRLAAAVRYERRDGDRYGYGYGDRRDDRRW